MASKAARFMAMGSTLAIAPGAQSGHDFDVAILGLAVPPPDTGSHEAASARIPVPSGRDATHPLFAIATLLLRATADCRWWIIPAVSALHKPASAARKAARSQ